MSALRRRESAVVRSTVRRCVARLEHGLMLSKTAVAGPEPEYAARYLVDALRAIRRDLPALRRFARRVS